MDARFGWNGQLPLFIYFHLLYLYIHRQRWCDGFTTWTTCFCIHTARLRWKVQFWASAERDGASTPEASAVSGENYSLNYVVGFIVTRVTCSSRPLPLELTAVGETVVMENLEIFRMNGFQFQIDMEGKPERDLIPGWIENQTGNWCTGISVSNCKYSCVHS